MSRQVQHPFEIRVGDNPVAPQQDDRHRAIVHVHGRETVIVTGSKLTALPSGSILIIPPAMSGAVPVEVTPEGDTRAHASLMPGG